MPKVVKIREKELSTSMHAFICNLAVGVIWQAASTFLPSFPPDFSEMMDCNFEL